MSQLLRRPAALPIVWLPLLALGAFVAVWQGQGVPAYDDVYYFRSFTQAQPGVDSGGFFLGRGEALSGVADAWRSFWLHREWNNGRLCQLFAFLTALLPRWAAAVCNAAVLMWLMSLVWREGARLGGVERLPLWWRSLTCLLAPAWFMFGDRMLSHDYFINYFWSALALVGFVGWYCRDGVPRRPVAGVLWAFFAGGMHEITCVMAWGAVAVWCVGGRSMPQGRERWLALAALAVGTAVFTLAPSNFARNAATGTFAGQLAEIAAHPTRLLAVGPRVIFVVVALAALAAMARRRARQVLTSRLAAVWWMMPVVSWAFFQLFISGARGWVPSVAAEMVLLGAAAPCFGPKPLPWLSAAMAAALSAWGGAVTGVQAGYLSDERAFYGELLAREAATRRAGAPPYPSVAIPAGVQRWWDMPWWTFGVIDLGLPTLACGQNLSRTTFHTPMSRLAVWGDTTVFPGSARLLGSPALFWTRNTSLTPRGRVHLGTPVRAARPWRRLGPDSLDVELYVIREYYAVAAPADTLWPVVFGDVMQSTGRMITRVDTLSTHAPWHP